jgi:site-specific DNA-cytosine methylase
VNTIELFCGTKSFSKVAAARAHSIFTVDNSFQFRPDICKDIRDVHASNFPYRPDVLWASPPCQGFSVAAIGRNWNFDNTPKTDSARLAMVLAQKTLSLIEASKPTWWFVENPRGKLRKMPFMEGLLRHTVTYCQYGDTRMKPTDIWTNALWWTPRPMCKNGDACHEAAPRGAKTGTQGLQGDLERSRIPAALFEEIFSQMPNAVELPIAA